MLSQLKLRRKKEVKGGRHNKLKTMSTFVTLFVGNIPMLMKLSEIENLFAVYGKPKRVYLSPVENVRNRKYAFIEYDFIEQAQAAIKGLHNIHPYYLKLKFSFNRDDRRSRPNDKKENFGSCNDDKRAITETEYKSRIHNTQTNTKPQRKQWSSRDDAQTRADTQTGSDAQRKTEVTPTTSCRKDALNKTEETPTTPSKDNVQSNTKETQTTTYRKDAQTNTNIVRKKIVYNYMKFSEPEPEPEFKLELYTPEQVMSIENWVDKAVKEALEEEIINVPFIPGKCAYCFNDSINMCSVCKTFYCDSICSRADWPKHSAECQLRVVEFSEDGHVKFSKELRRRYRTKSVNRSDRLPNHLLRSERFDFYSVFQDKDRAADLELSTNTTTTPIPTDRYTLVFVLYIDHFSYWVMLATNMDLMRDIAQLIQDHCSDPDILCDPTLENKCCAPFEGEMYRAKILSKTESTAMVRFVDYGNECEVQLNQIKSLSSRLTVIKPVAFQIKFAEGSTSELFLDCFYYLKAVEMMNSVCVVELKEVSEPLSASSPTELSLSSADLKLSDDVKTMDNTRVVELKEGSGSSPNKLPLSTADLKPSDGDKTLEESPKSKPNKNLKRTEVKALYQLINDAQHKEELEKIKESNSTDFQSTDTIKAPKRKLDMIEAPRRLWQAAFKNIKPIQKTNDADHEENPEIIPESKPSEDLENSDITPIKVKNDAEVEILPESKPYDDLNSSDIAKPIKMINDADFEKEPEVIPDMTEVVVDAELEVILEINDAELKTEPEVTPDMTEVDAEPEVMPEINDAQLEKEPEVIPDMTEVDAEPEVIPDINDAELETEPEVTPDMTEVDAEPEVIPDINDAQLEKEPEVTPDMTEVDAEPEVIPEINDAQLEKEPEVTPDMTEVVGDAEPEVIPEINEVGHEEAEVLPESKPSEYLNSSDLIKPIKMINDAEFGKEPEVAPDMTEVVFDAEPQVIPEINEVEHEEEAEVLPELKLSEYLNSIDLIKPIKMINDAEYEKEPEVIPKINELERKAERELISEINEVKDVEEAQVLPEINEVELENESEVLPEIKPSEDLNSSDFAKPIKNITDAKVEKEPELIPEITKVEHEEEDESLPEINKVELKVEPKITPDIKKLELEKEPEVIPEINKVELEAEPEVVPESKPCEDLNGSDIIKPTKMISDTKVEKEPEVIPEITKVEHEEEAESLPEISKVELKVEPEITPDIKKLELEKEPEVIPEINKVELEAELEVLPESTPCKELNGSDIIKPTKMINDAKVEKEPELIPEITKVEHEEEAESLPEINTVELKVEPEITPDINELELEILRESKPCEGLNGSDIIKPTIMIHEATLEDEPQVVPESNPTEDVESSDVIHSIQMIHEEKLEDIYELLPESMPTKNSEGNDIIKPIEIINDVELEEPQLIPKSKANENSKSSHETLSKPLIKMSNHIQLKEELKLLQEFMLTEDSESTENIRTINDTELNEEPEMIQESIPANMSLFNDGLVKCGTQHVGVRSVHDMKLLRNINAVKMDIILKSRPLSSDKFVNVRIISPEKGNVYWVVLEKRFSELRLINSMAIYFDEWSQINDPILDGLCIVRSEGVWCRAKVTNLNPLTVFFIDYGNSSLCRIEEMFELPSNLGDIPPLAIKIQLAKGTRLHFFNLGPLYSLKVKAALELTDNYYLVDVADASEEL